MLYAEYLKSKEWKIKKHKFINSKRFNDRCFICGERQKHFHIHHKTYKNLGKEKLWNLIVLCDICHYCVHHENGKRLPLTPQVLNNRVYKLKSKFKKL